MAGTNTSANDNLEILMHNVNNWAKGGGQYNSNALRLADIYIRNKSETDEIMLQKIAVPYSLGWLYNSTPFYVKQNGVITTASRSANQIVNQPLFYKVWRNVTYEA